MAEWVRKKDPAVTALAGVVQSRPSKEWLHLCTAIPIRSPALGRVRRVIWVGGGDAESHVTTGAARRDQAIAVALPRGPTSTSSQAGPIDY